MDRPVRSTRKRTIKAIQSDDSDEELTPTKKPRKVAKAGTGKSENVSWKKPEKNVVITLKKKSTKSKHTTESQALLETSQGDGPVLAKAPIAKACKVTENKNLLRNADDFSRNIWDESEMLSFVGKVPLGLARNFIALLTEGCTLPFIARYRKANVDHLMPDRLQELFESYQNVAQLKKKVKSVMETLKKAKKLTPEVEKSILNARSLSEVDFVYAPLKSHSLSLAERARNLGLESIAIRALNGEYVNVNTLCTSNEELSSPNKVEAHIMHIVADIIYKDTRVLEHMRSL